MILIYLAFLSCPNDNWLLWIRLLCSLAASRTNPPFSSSAGAWPLFLDCDAGSFSVLVPGFTEGAACGTCVFCRSDRTGAQELPRVQWHEPHQGAGGRREELERSYWGEGPLARILFFHFACWFCVFSSVQSDLLYTNYSTQWPFDELSVCQMVFLHILPIRGDSQP